MNTTNDASSDIFLPHMPDVARCEQALRELNQMWRLIESSAKMNCPTEARLLLPAMVATRTGFAHLEQALVANLVQEKVRHVLANLGTQARYAIDILVRNLFERTADVGFLATDADLCRFVAGLDDDTGAARQRLSDYRDKYTVYDEIVLLDLEGRVLVQADPATPLSHSADPLLRQTLDADGYVETFRATDLRPGKPRALVYSHRMLHPDTGEPAGVLCLCFNFEQEMDAIFHAYRDPSHRANMLLLDAQNHVISSADPLWIPPGVQVPTNPDGRPRLLMFGGREYLVRTFSSEGYQGYPGPAGWKGQLMIPVDLAFRGGAGAGSATLAGVEPQLMQGLLSHAEAFSPQLHELMSSVTRTTRTIERIVWNGKVTSAANDPTGANASHSGGINKLNTVLDQITETGERSDALFSRSIQDLYQTVLTSSISEAELTSQLLVDMLDRNLYERANDCRWWALSAQLRRGLAQPSPQQSKAIADVLGYINSLYTVYARLFVYDRGGRIIASTGGQEAVGDSIAADTLTRVCALRSELDHYPEPFAPSPLYGGESTFIYHAAIRHPEQSATVVGGIGIVFDAKPELLNMLRSGVAGRPNMQAYFVTPSGRVLAGTDAARAPGDQLELDAGLLAQADVAGAGGVARIMQHDGQYVIAACTRAAGYREFRAADGVEEPVLAVLLQSFGPVREGLRQAQPAVRIERRSDTGPDFAIFYAGRTLMALRAANIQEAVPFAKVQKAAGGNPARIGMLDVPLAGGKKHFVWVFDLALLATGRPGAVSENSQVMLVHLGESTIGLLVDDLHSVHQFDAADMTVSPLGTDDTAMAPRLIKANQGNLLIQEIDIERLFARLRT
jgi:chemotaxis signal transduction protein